jgi:exo-1,4-beta-D-glucosaminidase
MFEAFVANKPEATGVIHWMFNSAWPKLWWQLYDYSLQPTGAFYGARKAGEPVHLLYDYGSQEIVAVSGGAAAAKLKASIRVLDFGLKEVIAKTVDFGLAADEVKVIDAVRPPAGISPTYFLDLRLLGEKNRLLDANFYCLSAKAETLDEGSATWYVTPVKDYADLTALASLKPVAVKVRGKFSKDGAQTRVVVDIENPSPDLALMIEILVLREAAGQPVLPVYLDDNYITLLPKESRRISGLFLTEDLLGEEPKVTVRGWNVREEYK